MTCDLQSPDNAATACGTTIRLTPRNSYAPLRNESGSPSAADAILFYFRKLNLHYVLQQKFKNDSSSYRKLEDCHIVCYTQCCVAAPATVGNTKALRASTVAEAKPVLAFCWFARQQKFLEKHQGGRRHVGERVIFEFTLEHSSR